MGDKLKEVMAKSARHTQVLEALVPRFRVWGYTLRLQSSSFWGSILESLTKKRDTQTGTTLEPLGTVQDVLPAAETTPGDKDCPDPLHEKHRS